MNLGLNYKSNKCTVLYHNIRELYNVIKDLQITCHEFDAILCAEAPSSVRFHVSEVSLPGFNELTL